MIPELLNPKEPQQDISPSRKELHGRLVTFYTTSTRQPPENGWNLTCSSPLHSEPHSWESSTSSPGSPGCRGGRSWGKKSCLGRSKRGPCWRVWSCLQTFLIFKRFGSNLPTRETQCGQDNRARLELPLHFPPFPWHTDFPTRWSLLCFRLPARPWAQSQTLNPLVQTHTNLVCSFLT